MLSAPTNQPTLDPKVQTAPSQPTLAPSVSTRPPQPPFSPRVVTQPTQPSINPTVQPQPQGLGTIATVGPVGNQQPFTPKLSLEEFAQTIKTQYPQYTNKHNRELALAILSKYPQYQDRVFVPISEADKSLAGFISNIPKSGVSAIKNLLTAVLHPVKTVEGIAQILAGALASDFTLGEKSTPQFDAFAKFLTDRYGSVEGIKKTVYEDPVGFLIDLSSVLDAGGSLVAKIGDVAKVSELSRVGEIISKAGEITNPVSIAGKGAKLTFGKATDVTSELLGFETGAGGGAIKEAFNNPSKGFYEGMRGKASPETIVEEARQALGTAKTQRAASYQSALEGIKNAPQTLDILPIKQTLSEQLKKFGIEIDDSGQLNFANSTISDAADKAKVQQAFEDISRWDRNQKNLAPVGVDTLKRRLGNLYSPTSDVRALTTALKSSANQLLKDKVPGYEAMTKAYSEASDFIDDVTKGLSLGDKTSTDTALRKLASALKQNNEFRQELVSQLEEIGGQDLTGKIAGYNLSAILPRGLFGKIVEGSTIYAAFSGLTSLFSLPTLAALASTSPRLIGEVLGALGVAKQQTTKVIQVLSKYNKGNVTGLGLKAGYYEQKANPGQESGPK